MKKIIEAISNKMTIEEKIIPDELLKYFIVDFSIGMGEQSDMIYENIRDRLDV